MPTAIEFENISKQYRLGLVSTRTLSHDLNRWWQMNILGKEDPYLKIGSVNDRASKADSEYVWALKNIDFKVEQGDVVGIIGKNGAGKSTLLKLLSRVTNPTTGVIRARGRIASLLEVGTGFHQELTGRENIYMNGSIMGMTKQEITRKLDEIVDFSGCERYIDTPVKRYSSGMTVRLGFAVAAHLDPEILVVDEVLAVGDAEFQKKAIGKMQDVSKGEGRTVLFVSHNMESIRQLCKTGVVLKNGSVEFSGTANDCVDYYIGTNIQNMRSYADNLDQYRIYKTMKEFEYLDVRMLNDIVNVGVDEPLRFEMTVKRNKHNIKKAQFGFVVNNSSEQTVGMYYSDEIDLPENAEVFKISIVCDHHNLAKGKYSLNFNIAKFDYTAEVMNYDIVTNVLQFKISYFDAAHKKPFMQWPVRSDCLFRGVETSLVKVS